MTHGIHFHCRERDTHTHTYSTQNRRNFLFCIIFSMNKNWTTVYDKKQILRDEHTSDFYHYLQEMQNVKPIIMSGLFPPIHFVSYLPTPKFNFEQIFFFYSTLSLSLSLLPWR